MAVHGCKPVRAAHHRLLFAATWFCLFCEYEGTSDIYAIQGVNERGMGVGRCVCGGGRVRRYLWYYLSDWFKFYGQAEDGDFVGTTIFVHNTLTHLGLSPQPDWSVVKLAMQQNHHLYNKWYILREKFQWRKSLSTVHECQQTGQEAYHFLKGTRDDPRSAGFTSSHVGYLSGRLAVSCCKIGCSWEKRSWEPAVDRCRPSFRRLSQFWKIVSLNVHAEIAINQK